MLLQCTHSLPLHCAIHSSTHSNNHQLSLQALPLIQSLTHKDTHPTTYIVSRSLANSILTSMPSCKHYITSSCYHSSFDTYQPTGPSIPPAPFTITNPITHSLIYTTPTCTLKHLHSIDHSVTQSIYRSINRLIDPWCNQASTPTHTDIW